MFAAAAYTGCPLYENLKIVQQPADFLKLSQRYVDAATGFIHDQAGVLICVCVNTCRCTVHIWACACMYNDMSLHVHAYMHTDCVLV